MAENPPVLAQPLQPVAQAPSGGISRVALESGAGQGAVLDDSGAPVNLTAAFGRPNVKMAPLLGRPDTEPDKVFGNQFQEGWGKVAKQIGGAPIPEPVEENPFDLPPSNAATLPEAPFIEPTPEEAANEAIPGTTQESLIEELDELRKVNRRLKAAAKKNGAAEAMERIEQLERELAETKEATLAVQKVQPGLQTALPKWEGKDLRILFPCYKTTNPATAFVMLALALDFGRERIGFLPGLGDARISNTRNRLAAEFLESGAKWAFWMDDDMIPTIGRADFIRKFIGATPNEVPDSVLNVHVVERLMASGAKLIGGCYFGRRQHSPAMFKEGIDNAAAYQKAKKVSGEVLPTEWVGTGCLLVHRDVFLGIQTAHPELAPAGDRPFWDFFREGQGQSEGEDVMFCRRAKKAGFQAFVDTGAQCFHIGFCSFGFHNTDYEVQRQQGLNREQGWYR
jgi:hypothetical protein